MAVLDDIKADIAEIKKDLAEIVANIPPTGGISADDAAQLKTDLDGVVTSMDAIVNPVTPPTTTP